VRPKETITVETNYHAEDTAGYCSQCNKIVPRDKDANCAAAGHEAERVSGLVPLDENGKVPFQLPGFNWGAALMPPVWGPIHGVFAAAIVLPIFVFANNSLQNAFTITTEAGPVARIVVWLITAGIIFGTAYFMYYVGARGWGIAWNKSPISKQPEVTQEMFDDFIKREHMWTALSAVLFIGFVYLVVNFWIL